jgi:hypothetical protein
MIIAAGSMLVCSVASAQSFDFGGFGSRVFDVYACLEPNCMMEANSPYYPNEARRREASQDHAHNLNGPIWSRRAGSRQPAQRAGSGRRRASVRTRSTGGESQAC